jgi:regulation of enolase protein 1 (concanavalin A-like superfamily)
MTRFVSALVLCALAAPPAAAIDPARWQAIVSREGGFTVDMPGPPVTKTDVENTPEGQLRAFVMACETDEGDFVAFRIDVPGGAPRGQEERVLDSMGRFFAKMWHGKVLTEKQVRSAFGVPGRDFTIQGRPEKRGALSLIRVRIYLSNRAVFAVAVVSPEGESLPVDTGRFLGSLFLGDARTRASGVPDPEVEGRPLAGWGFLVDPDGDCQFTPGTRAMTVDVPATMHDLNPAMKKSNAPRVMADVTGDFSLTVRVGGEFHPGPRSTNPTSVPYHGAGILVWINSDNHIRLERANLLRNGQNRPHVAFIECEGGYGGANHSENVGDGPVWLRMERKGSRIFAAISENGVDWKSLRPIDTLWPERLKVGLSVVSTSSSPFQVRFEEYDFRAAPGPPRGVASPPVSAPPRPGTPPPAPNTYLPPAPVAAAPSSGTGSSRTVLIVVSLVLVLAAVVIIVAIILAVALMKNPAQPRRRAKPARRRDDYD